MPWLRFHVPMLWESNGQTKPKRFVDLFTTIKYEIFVIVEISFFYLKHNTFCLFFLLVLL